MYYRFQLAPDRQKGSDKIHETPRFFFFGVVLLLGRRRRVLRTLIRTAPDSQEGHNKSHLSQTFAPDSQKGSDTIRETTRFFGSGLRFCWVGGVECYELFYVRHLTVRRVQIKATCHKKGFHLYNTSLGVTPEAKTGSATKRQPARKRTAACLSTVAGLRRS